MKIKVHDKMYDIQWKYDNVMSKSGKADVVQTTCTVSWVDESIKQGRDRYKPVTSASVVQNPKDRHEKSKARKISLAKVMSMLAVPSSVWQDKNFRQKIWDIYFDHCRV